jgi:mRNA-degrading endonuclease RelE of RelBE toxin-antitoxin system
MKRNHAKRRKEWKELEENLRNQVNELLVEVEYLESIRTKPKEDLTMLEFSA